MTVTDPKAEVDAHTDRRSRSRRLSLRTLAR